MLYIIFHGSFGSPKENWFPWLKRELEERGEKVLIPRFPTENWDEFTKRGPQQSPKIQNLENWLRVFGDYFSRLNRDRNDNRYCFIGHSLGPLFILHVVDKLNIPLEMGIFVSPFLTLPPNIWQFDLVNRSFYKEDFDWNKLKKLIPKSYVLYGDNDPYVDKKYPEEFAGKLGSNKVIIPEGGHLNSEAGYSTFPKLLKIIKQNT